MSMRAGVSAISRKSRRETRSVEWNARFNPKKIRSIRRGVAANVPTTFVAGPAAVARAADRSDPSDWV